MLRNYAALLKGVVNMKNIDFTLGLEKRTFIEDEDFPYYLLEFNFHETRFDEKSDEDIQEKVGYILVKLYVMEKINYTLKEMASIVNFDNTDDPIILDALRVFIKKNPKYKPIKHLGKFITLDTVFIEEMYRGNRLALKLIETVLTTCEEAMSVDLALLHASPISESMTKKEKEQLKPRLANYYKELSFEHIAEHNGSSIMMKTMYEF